MIDITARWGAYKEYLDVNVSLSFCRLLAIDDEYKDDDDNKENTTDENLKNLQANKNLTGLYRTVTIFKNMTMKPNCSSISEAYSKP